MHMITLTSDWNNDDYYVASLKGKLVTLCPDSRIVDISHQVKPFSSAQAAFLVRNSYPNFPKGTIHIIAVNSEPEEERDLLAARMDGHFFLCADNGMLGLLGGPGPELVVRIGDKPDEASSSFISMSVFANVACKLSGGTPLKKLGSPTDSYEKQVPLRPAIEELTISGSVIHIDSYQNAITNVTRELFERVGKGRPFHIYVQSKSNLLEKINSRYNEAREGDLLAIFNSVGLLEIAIRNGNAAGLLKLSTSSTIRVEFKEENNA
ncbi:MAG: SAM-dependent chlorinase/fluorinase [Bacteroidota bacterium]